MDLNQLKDKLAASVQVYEKVESEYKEQIAAEIETLEKLLSFLMPILPETTINGQRAVLIYVFEASEKRTIAPEVYYCEDGKIRYQVYNKEGYQNFNPLVEYEGAYAVVTAEKMFRNLDLSDVVDFFEERVESLPLMAQDLYEGTEVRKSYLKKFNSIAKKVF